MTLEIAQRTRRIGRALLPLGMVFLAVGIGSAVVGPFLSLFLSTAVHAGPVRVTVFLFVAPLAGVISATLLGRLSDRRPIRRTLLIGASAAGMISMAATAVVRDYWVLLVLAVTVNALAGSLFSQTFAYARQVLTRDDPGRAALGISTLRTVFSVAWVGGPPLSAFLLNAGGFATVYGMSAVMYGIAALVGVFFLSEIGSPASPTRDPTASQPAPDPGPVPDDPDALEVPRSTLLLTALAFTLLQCPLTLAVQAMPLFIRDDLGGNVTDAGFVLGLCAALEIPLMLGLGALTTRIPVRLLVLAGCSCGMLYYAIVAAASGVWMLGAAQLVDAIFIAAVSGLGISYMQDMLPRHPGRATTLSTNAFPIGAMLAGPLFGLAQHFGYRLAYVMATALCAAGLLLLVLVRPVAARTTTGGGSRRAPRTGDPAALAEEFTPL